MFVYAEAFVDVVLHLTAERYHVVAGGTAKVDEHKGLPVVNACTA